MQFEVAFSFNKSDPLIECIEFSSPPSEAEFTFRALSILKKSQRAELRYVSACQFANDYSSACSWLLKSRGKYRFGVDDDA